MKPFTKEQLTKLLNNGNSVNRGKDHKPVVKLFTPDAACTWLLTEIDPEETDIAFGLCDLCSLPRNLDNLLINKNCLL